MKTSKLIFIALTVLAFAIHPVAGAIMTGITAYSFLDGMKPDWGYLGVFGTRFSDTSKANAFDPQGIASYSLIAYAAAVSLTTPVQPALRHYYDFATLTGAMTINAPAAMIAQLREGDEIYMNIPVDATGRTVTWGTNFRAAVAATFVQGASQFGLVKAMFVNSKIHILAQTTAA